MEFTNIDKGGVDTIGDPQRHTHFNLIFNLDDKSIFISRSIFHAPHIQCHVGAIKNGSNGSIPTAYTNLKYGMDIVRQKDKAIVYSISHDGPTFSDQSCFEEIHVTGFSDGDHIEEGTNLYDATFWFMEGEEGENPIIQKSIVINIQPCNHDTPGTFERSAINKMIYNEGYYPTDEEWEAHQKYLEDGATRPIAPN